MNKLKEVNETTMSKLPGVKTEYVRDDDVAKDLVYIEKLALRMGFRRDDVILFDNLTAAETW